MYEKSINKVWKTIEIGGKTAEEQRTELADVGVIVHPLRDRPNRRKVDLVLATVRELGFQDGATTCEIISRVNELGLELCPVEIRVSIQRILEAESEEPVHIGMYRPERSERGVKGDDGWLIEIATELQRSLYHHLHYEPEHRWQPELLLVFMKSV